MPAISNRKRPKLTAAKIKALKNLARRIDAEEQTQIKALGREIFEYHGIARETVRQLQSRRVALGMSLAELSNRTGIAKSNLSRLETNQRASPTLETIHRYAQALGLHVSLELKGQN